MGSHELVVESFLEKCSTTKVNQLYLECIDIYENVLILDISVNNSFLMAFDDSVHQLHEEFPSHMFRQGAPISDEVKKVLAVEPLHDNIERVRSIKIGNKFDHSRNIIHSLHQSYFQWDIVFSNQVNVF